MGLNNEYAFDTLTLDDADYSGDDIEAPDYHQVDPQSWQDWHSEHILNLFETVKEYFGMYYRPLNVSFNDWNTFLFNHRVAGLRDPLYITNDTWLAALYDQLVSYCETNELSFLSGVPFSDFQNFIYYRAL